MRAYYIIFLGAFIICTSCSDKPSESQPESGHTALGTSAPPAVNPVRTDSLHYLSQYIGQYPDSIALWETQPLKAKLENLLDTDLDRFLALMQQAQPLKQQRVLYTISGNAKPADRAFLLVDTQTNQLHVSIIEDGIRKQFQTPGEELYLPYEVEQHL